MDIKDTVKESIKIENVARQLGLKLTKNGKTLQGECPTGHPSKNGVCFCVNTEKNLFNCFHCNAAGDIFDLVQLAKGTDFQTSLEWLTENFLPHISPELKKQAIEKEPEKREYYKNYHFLEWIYQYGKVALYRPEGEEALNYLVFERGYDRDRLKETEWMYFPPVEDIRDLLFSEYAQYSEEVKQHIENLKLIGHFGDNFRLAFPYRDRQGIITGFVKRALNPAGITVKTYDGKTHDGVRYDSTPGLKKSDLFNLHNCKGSEELIIVEGYPDALYFPALGLKNIAAVGQGNLSKTHLEGLKHFGVKRVIISFDNDPTKEDGTITGVKNTENAIDLLRDNGIIPFVVDPSWLSPHKDPDEFVQDKGIEAFRELAKSAKRCVNWKADRILGNHDLNTDIGRSKAFKEVTSKCGDLSDPIDNLELQRTLTKEFGFSDKTLESMISKQYEVDEKQRLKDDLQGYLTKAEAMLKEGDADKALEMLSVKVKYLGGLNSKIGRKPTVSLGNHLQSKHEKERQREPGTKLGYGLSKFFTIGKNLDGIQPGLILIVADTNIGKTAFLTNLFLDILETNPHASGIYFSLDDNKDVIINRLLGIKTGISLNRVQRKQENEQDQNTIEMAYKDLIELSGRGRLNILDNSDIIDMSSLEVVVREKAMDNLFVAIDGLYNIGLGKGNIRDVNIERANRLKALADIHNIPAICTAEVRKRPADRRSRELSVHDIMETGKYAFNANLVWTLSPENAKDFKEDEEATLKLAYEKNKFSHFTGYNELTFIKKCGVIKE